MQKIKINKTDYPIRFGMREVMDLSKAGVSTGDEGEISLEYDVLLQVYVSALKKGAIKEGNTFEHDIAWLEEQIDEDPALFELFNKTFEKSKIAVHLDSQTKSALNKKK